MNLEKIFYLQKSNGMSNYDFTCSLPPYKEPKDQSRQKVFSAIQKLQPCTSKQIAEYLKLDSCQVVGRVNELVKSKLVRSKEKKPDPVSGRTVNYWETTDWVKDEKTGELILID